MSKFQHIRLKMTLNYTKCFESIAVKFTLQLLCEHGSKALTSFAIERFFRPTFNHFFFFLLEQFGLETEKNAFILWYYTNNNTNNNSLIKIFYYYQTG